MSDLHQAVQATIAAHTPDDVPPFALIRARRRTRDRRRATTTGAALAVVAGAVFAASTLTGPSDPPPAAVAPGISAGPSAETLDSSPSPDPVAAETRTGAVSDNSDAACAYMYDPETLAERTFAFDGTVVGIGPGTTNRPDMGQMGTVAVTFQVTEWFRAGEGPEVTVDMVGSLESWEQWEEDENSYWHPPYDVGTRLLVSGEPRWDGAPLEDAIAWTCGFTRYYDEATADAWRAATSQALPSE